MTPAGSTAPVFTLGLGAELGAAEGEPGLLVLLIETKNPESQVAGNHVEERHFRVLRSSQSQTEPGD